MTVWFITGASRGFGLELARAALEHGDRVVATARDPQLVLDALRAQDGLCALQLDVTVESQAREAVARAMQAFGRIDVLVNNAGYGLFGGLEETTDQQIRAVFDTNVFGLLNVTRAALPILRAQRSGFIVNMSSSAGFAVSAGRGPYGASKFAVEAVTEALRAEVAPFGVHVTAVEPGSFRTGFLSSDSRRAAATSIPEYADSVGALLTAIDRNDGRQPGDPLAAVRAIRQLVTLADPPTRLALGSDAVALVEAKLRAVRTELDEWRAVSLSTDFGGDAERGPAADGRSGVADTARGA